VHILNTGELWQKLTEQTELALSAGSLVTIETDYSFIEDGGVRFMVRLAKNLKRKIADKARHSAEHQKTGENFNPFMPPEADLQVGTIPPDHIAVLNKFNVVDNHLLIVTSDFVDQETLLTQQDFRTLIWSMNEFPSLAFYNGGKVGGASQPHKHLQLVPLPLCGAKTGTPMDAIIPADKLSDSPQSINGLPFTHRIAALPGDLLDINIAAESLFQLYQAMLDDLDLPPTKKDGIWWQTSPYNLLVTRDWMLLVPRAREKIEEISINSLGFAGSLFVFDEAALQRVHQIGPMQVLKGVVEE
jgi:ATP adenylyltransferase